MSLLRWSSWNSSRWIVVVEFWLPEILVNASRSKLLIIRRPFLATLCFFCNIFSEALIALTNVWSVLFDVTVAFEASAGLVADRFYRKVNTVRNVCVVGIVIIIHAFVAPERCCFWDRFVPSPTCRALCSGDRQRQWVVLRQSHQHLRRLSSSSSHTTCTCPQSQRALRQIQGCFAGFSFFETLPDIKIIEKVQEVQRYLHIEHHCSERSETLFSFCYFPLEPFDLWSRIIVKIVYPLAGEFSWNLIECYFRISCVC